MARLHRPHIPVPVRIDVALRQCRERGIQHPEGDGPDFRGARLLAMLLRLLFGNASVELHHRPALVNRQWNARRKDYIPLANDPVFLVYLAEDDHDIETRVRGEHGQRSDLAQARYNKRVQKNRERLPRSKTTNLPKPPSYANRRTHFAVTPTKGTFAIGMKVTGGPFGNGGRIVWMAKQKLPSRPWPKGRKLRGTKCPTHP